MYKLLRVFTLVVLSACFGGCGGPDRTEIRQRHQSSLQSFQAVSYRRTNTAMGTEDHITIAKDGSIEANGKNVGTIQGHASELQMMQLAALFEGWDKLQSAYPAPDTASDSPVTEIRYGEKVVTTADAARTIPPQFALARQKLESIVRQIARGQ